MASLDDLLARLSAAGGDTADIEVKAAAGGLSPSVTSSLCALANLPRGGWLILGLDERSGFQPVGLPDPQALKQGVAGKARACTPPVNVTFEDAVLEGEPVIVVEVAECAPSAKPCRETATGQAWLRSWDGDFTMSSLEEQAFLAQREQPHFDREPVAGATFADLDPDLLELWGQTVTELDPHGLGRFAGREQLFRAGVITAQDVPTKAGLLALGLHPQQFFPRYVINLAAVPSAPVASGAVRARELVTLSGPIPTMLDAALDWAQRVFVREVVETGAGGVRDAWTYPLEAFRELVGNALVHRDLDSWSEGMAIEVRLQDDRLVVTNPGGLYGITADRLGQEGTTSAKNARLVEVCKYTRSATNERVVETLASGIPRVLTSLEMDRHPAPLFQDNGLRFTAVVRSRTARDARAAGRKADSQRQTYTRASEATQKLSTPAQLVLEAIGPEWVGVAKLQGRTGLQPANLRYHLRALRDAGLVEQEGGRGRPTSYRRLDT